MHAGSSDTLHFEGLADFVIDGLHHLQRPRIKPVAVVDIGSNSVRLVVYDGLRRAAAPMFNEKVLAGLGRGLAASGRLSPDGVERALAALRRFGALNARMGVKKVFAFATAAAREADNGPDFIRAAVAALGAPISVLSGPEEARYAALGTLAGIPDADGVVGDLGGGSLELVRVKGGKAKPGVTLPLGPLRLADETGGEAAAAGALIDQRLAGATVLEKLQSRAFYAVGGAWRNLARIHMAQTDYPLRITHQYSIPRHEALRLTEQVAAMTPEEIVRLAGIGEKRAETMPLAARVLNRIFANSGARNLVFSIYGVREGVLFAQLPKKRRKADPLLSACWDFARRYARSPLHELELCAFSEQLCAPGGLECTRRWARLRHAAAMLADIGWRANPDYRGARGFTIVSQASFTGVDHYSRAFLALTVLFRYEGPGATPPPEIAALVDDKAIRRARVLAALFRLAYGLSAAMPGVLPDIELTIEDGALALHLTGDHAALAGEAVEKRLAALARLLGLRGEARTA